MTFAFDIDGTITRAPDVFAAMAAALRQAGHGVVIVTFREDREGALRDLASWGVAFDTLIISDSREMMALGAERWKGVVCRRLGAAVLIDDDEDVIAALPEEVVGLRVV